MKKLLTYENYVVALMALIFGCIFFDRLALNFLIPYVAKDLLLSDTQIGLLAGALSFAWAISSYSTTAFAEAKNAKRVIFLLGVLVFSICSFGSGLANSFIVLLLARLVMGMAEGPIIPLAQSFVEKESSPNRLGMNAGILQAVGSALCGSILAPVVLVQLAENMGWREAFFIAGTPGIILGFIAYFTLRPTTTQTDRVKEVQQTGIKELLQYVNVRKSMGIACAIFGWWFASLPFITKYFVNVQGMSGDEMGKTMGLLGVSGLLSAIIVPTLSDKFGRKKILLIFVFIGIFYPLFVQFLAGSALQLPAMFLSYFMMGTLPIAAAVLPLEAVPDHLKAKSLGFITATGEIIGGVLVPAIAGVLSDAINPSAFLWVSSGLAVIGFLFLLNFKESDNLKQVH
jgi:MFS family permease